MDIKLRLAFDEKAAVRLLNWLAQENARELRLYDRRARRFGSRPLPSLYESGVLYRREEEETWSDYLNLLLQGHEDCDALAAARAGELIARGWRMLRPRSAGDAVRYPGDQGYEIARRDRPKSIHAEVMLTTHAEPGESGLYHCVVRYWLGGRWFRDDPSARLGMYDGEDALLSREALLETLQSQPTASGRRLSDPRIANAVLSRGFAGEYAPRWGAQSRVPAGSPRRGIRLHRGV